jgi:hypothetical protein
LECCADAAIPPGAAYASQFKGVNVSDINPRGLRSGISMVPKGIALEIHLDSPFAG